MKYPLMLLLATLCLATQITSPQILVQMQARTENVIDDGLALLNALHETAEQELGQIIQNNDDALTHLNEEINQAESELHEAQDACMVLSDDLALMKQQYEFRKGDIQVFEVQIVQNQKRIDTLEEIRCQSSVEWLNFIRQSKYVLNLIEFLRQAIQNYNSFSEIHNFSALLQTVQTEDFNDQDILQNLDKISKTKAIGPVKQELLELLDQIEKSVKSKINTSQSDEVLTSSRIGDYLKQLEREIDYLDSELSRMSDLWGDKPEETMVVKQKELDVCESHIKTKVDATMNVKEQVTQRQIQNEELQSKMIRQRDIVNEIINEYQVGFLKIAEAYKLRIEDYHEDGVFDKTVEFDKRQLSEYFGDKKEKLSEYAEAVVKGEVEPIKVDLQSKPEEVASVEGESEAEETEETYLESEESEESEETEETETDTTNEEQTTEEQPTEEIATEQKTESDGEQIDGIEGEIWQ